MAEYISKKVVPIRERILEIRAEDGFLAKVVKDGKEKARASADKTVAEVREIMGFKPF